MMNCIFCHQAMDNKLPGIGHCKIGYCKPCNTAYRLEGESIIQCAIYYNYRDTTYVATINPLEHKCELWKFAGIYAPFISDNAPIERILKISNVPFITPQSVREKMSVLLTFS